MSTDTKVPLQKLVEALTAIPFNRMLGLRLDQIDETEVHMSFSMKKDLIGNFLYGILHGGVISSVLDMAGGMIAMAAVVKKHANPTIEILPEIVGKCSTVDLHISFLNPGKGEQFTAQAWLIKMGNKLAFTRMELHNQEKSLIATANGTYLVA